MGRIFFHLPIGAVDYRLEHGAHALLTQLESREAALHPAVIKRHFIREVLIDDPDDLAILSIEIQAVSRIAEQPV